MEYNKSFLDDIFVKAKGKIDDFSKDFDISKIPDVFSNAFKKQVKASEHVNILIAGKSGAGKSTLINSIFGEDLAKTGTGKPVTQEVHLYQNDSRPLRIYDTKGLELDNAKDISDEIKNKILAKKNGTKSDEMIGVIWYTVAANAGRIEQTEIDFINELVNSNIDVPVIIVLTKADNRAEFIPLQEAIEAENLDIDGIVKVLAKPQEMHHPITDEITGIIESYGLDELVQKTSEVLPDLQRVAFINQQRINNELKLQQAKENKAKAKIIVKTSVGAAFAEGFAPIPFADSAMMIPTQMAMIAGITAAYGIKLSSSVIKNLAVGFAGVEAAAFTGKMISSNLLKLIPVVGTISGGIISGSTGAAITSAVGLAYISLIETKQENGLSESEFEVYINNLDFKEIMGKIDEEDINKLTKEAKDMK